MVSHPFFHYLMPLCCLFDVHFHMVFQLGPFLHVIDTSVPAVEACVCLRNTNGHICVGEISARCTRALHGHSLRTCGMVTQS